MFWKQYNGRNERLMELIIAIQEICDKLGLI